MHRWRRGLLRVFGADVGRGVRIDNTVRIFYPPHLVLGDSVVIGHHVDLYNVAEICIGDNSMVSQYTYLCSASHDYRQATLPLIAKKLRIGSRTWVCAKVFVGPGVIIGDDCVVAAASVVVRNIASGQVVGGHPARKLKDRF